jgi:hypothetical protein
MVERSFSSPRLSLLVHRSRLGQVDPSVLTQGIIDSPTVGPPEHVHPMRRHTDRRTARTARQRWQSVPSLVMPRVGS